jgi:hypothetical protein
MAANFTDFSVGAVLTSAQLNGVLDNFQDIAIFNETQAGATAGGGATAGAFDKRTLNTTVINNIGGCSIASSVITLATAGTYYLNAKAPAFKTNQSQARLRNTTAGTTIIVGQPLYLANADNVAGVSIVEGFITITASTNIELQMRVATTVASEGFGVAGGYDSNIYSTLLIRRIA